MGVPTLAAQFEPVEVETMTSLVESIHRAVIEANNRSENINGKLFGENDASNEKMHEPNNLASLLYQIQAIAYRTNDVLAQIDNRIR